MIIIHVDKWAYCLQSRQTLQPNLVAEDWTGMQIVRVHSSRQNLNITRAWQLACGASSMLSDDPSMMQIEVQFGAASRLVLPVGPLRLVCGCWGPCWVALFPIWGGNERKIRPRPSSQHYLLRLRPPRTDPGLAPRAESQHSVRCKLTRSPPAIIPAGSKHLPVWIEYLHGVWRYL